MLRYMRRSIEVRVEDAVAALEVDAALRAKEHGLWVQDTVASLEVDAALHAHGPELMSGLLQRRQLAMIFRLWGPQARECVNRAAVAAVLEFFYRQGWPAWHHSRLLHAVTARIWHAWINGSMHTQGRLAHIQTHCPRVHLTMAQN